MQQAPPEGTPWWAWLLVTALAVFVLPMYRVWSEQRKQAAEHRATAIRLARVDHQVTNEHKTNLRDDVDGVGSEATRGADAAEEAARIAKQALEIVKGLAENHAETRRDMGGMRSDIRSISTRIDEETVERRKESREAREDRVRIETRLDDHINHKKKGGTE